MHCSSLLLSGEVPTTHHLHCVVQIVGVRATHVGHRDGFREVWHGLECGLAEHRGNSGTRQRTAQDAFAHCTVLCGTSTFASLNVPVLALSTAVPDPVTGATRMGLEEALLVEAPSGAGRNGGRTVGSRCGRRRRLT